MKALFVGSLLLSALAISPAASADSWFGSFGHARHYGPDFSRHTYSRHGFSRHGYSRNYRGYRGHGYWNSRYNRGYRRSGSHVNLSFGHGRHGHSDFAAGALPGGIVLGSVISSTVRDYREPRYETVTYRSQPVVRTTRVVRVAEPTVSPRVVSRSAINASTGRRLLRDLEGNCFEISRNSNGDEVRQQLPAEECNY